MDGEKSKYVTFQENHMKNLMNHLPSYRVQSDHITITDLSGFEEHTQSSYIHFTLEQLKSTPNHIYRKESDIHIMIIKSGAQLRDHILV